MEGRAVSPTQSISVTADLLVPCNHTNQSPQSVPELLGDPAGVAGTGPVDLAFSACDSCHGDLIVTCVSVTKLTGVTPFSSEGTVPDPPLLMPWPFPNLLVPLVQQWQGLDLTPGRSALKEITTNKGRMKHYVFNTLEEGERCFYIVLPFSL